MNESQDFSFLKPDAFPKGTKRHYALLAEWPKQTLLIYDKEGTWYLMFGILLPIENTDEGYTE